MIGPLCVFILVHLFTQVTLNEEIVVGSRLSLSVTLEGIIPIKIPCLDIGGTNLGSWYLNHQIIKK